ncbi:MAG: hypothetical protein IJX18_01195 [Clostridia bacterium]|nr:hypothetical protein [Clostridia bacterium]
MKVLLQNSHPYQLLERERRHGGLSHAYLLLSADEDILRESLLFFAGVFFKDNDRACALIEKESFCDCLVFPKAGKKLTVEDATTIVEEAGIHPLEGEIKLFIVDGFQNASPAVQNKLLKILEEPPQGVCFLLGATTEFSLLPTVLSRVKKLELTPFTTAQTEGYLQRNYPSLAKEEISFLAAASCGKISSVRSFIGEGFYKQVFEDALALSFAPLSSLPALCKKIGETKKKDALLSLLEILFRDTAFLKAKKGLDSYLLAPFYKKEMEKLLSLYSVGVLLTFQQKLREAQKQLKFNANFSWCLQSLFVWLAGNRKN